jgi:hypothetical protein
MSEIKEACAGLFIILMTIFGIGLVVSSCVSLGYGIKFLATDFKIFHNKDENGDCNGEELWNVLVGSVATGVMDLLACVTIFTSAIMSVVFSMMLCVETPEEMKEKICNYYCMISFSLAYSLTFAILINNEYENLNGCPNVMNSNLGTFSKVKFYLHLINSWAILLSLATLIGRFILQTCGTRGMELYKETKAETETPTKNIVGGESKV